jgi:hypothetical protein
LLAAPATADAALTPGANSHDDVVNCVAGALTNLIVVEQPQPMFGTYSRNAPASELGYCGRGPVGASAVYASMPAEHWAAQGIFHPNGRQFWIDRGVWKPPSTEQGSTK